MAEETERPWVEVQQDIALHIVALLGGPEELQAAVYASPDDLRELHLQLCQAVVLSGSDVVIDWSADDLIRFMREERVARGGIKLVEPNEPSVTHAVIVGFEEDHQRPFLRADPVGDGKSYSTWLSQEEFDTVTAELTSDPTSDDEEDHAGYSLTALAIIESVLTGERDHEFERSS